MLTEHPESTTSTQSLDPAITNESFTTRDGGHQVHSRVRVATLAARGFASYSTGRRPNLNTDNRQLELGVRTAGHITSRRIIELGGGIDQVLKWTGVILEIDEYSDEVTAELTPTDHDGPTVIAELDVSLFVRHDDRVDVGSYFYLTNRRVSAPGGGSAVTTTLRLQRLGRWTEDDVLRLTNSATEQLSWLRANSE